MAAGTPVVGTNNTSMVELLEGDSGGWLVEGHRLWHDMGAFEHWVSPDRIYAVMLEYLASKSNKEEWGVRQQDATNRVREYEHSVAVAPLWHEYLQNFEA